MYFLNNSTIQVLLCNTVKYKKNTISAKIPKILIFLRVSPNPLIFQSPSFEGPLLSLCMVITAWSNLVISLFVYRFMCSPRSYQATSTDFMESWILCKMSDLTMHFAFPIWFWDVHQRQQKTYWIEMLVGLSRKRNMSKESFDKSLINNFLFLRATS